MMTAEAATRAMCSCAAWTCRAARNVNWSTTGIGDYTLDGSESGMLAFIGGFRVLSERDLRDSRDERFDIRHRLCKVP